MKVFVSYAHTDEDEVLVLSRLARLRDMFVELGIDHYINVYDSGYQALIDTNAPAGEYLRHVFKDLDSCDTILVLMSSPRRSEGMLMEVGASVWLEKKIILAQHVSSVNKTYLPTLAECTFIWQSEDELIEKLAAALTVGTRNGELTK